MFEQMRFGAFYSALSGEADLAESYITRGAVERLWDTTTPFTFHLWDEYYCFRFFYANESYIYMGTISIQEDFHTHRDQLFHLFLVLLWNPFLTKITYHIACLSTWCMMLSDGRNIHSSNNLTSFSLFFLAWSSLLILGTICISII